jgi:hypothetical protein
MLLPFFPFEDFSPSAVSVRFLHSADFIEGISHNVLPSREYKMKIDFLILKIYTILLVITTTSDSRYK